MQRPTCMLIHILRLFDSHTHTTKSKNTERSFTKTSTLDSLEHFPSLQRNVRARVLMAASHLHTLHEKLVTEIRRLHATSNAALHQVVHLKRGGVELRV